MNMAQIVDGHQAAKLIGIGVKKGGGAGIARSTHEHIEPAQMVENQVAGGWHRRRSRDIELDRTVRRRTDRIEGGLAVGQVGLATGGNADGRTAVSQVQGERPPDATAPANHKHAFAGEEWPGNHGTVNEGQDSQSLTTMHWVVGISITSSGLSAKNSVNAASTPASSP
jgi:hypothetical protein